MTKRNNYFQINLRDRLRSREHFLLIYSYRLTYFDKCKRRKAVLSFPNLSWCYIVLLKAMKIERTTVSQNANICSTYVISILQIRYNKTALGFRWFGKQEKTKLHELVYLLVKCNLFWCLCNFVDDKRTMFYLINI